MRILLIGHNAREHAFACRLSAEGCDIFACGTKPNAGLEQVCLKYFCVESYSDVDAMIGIAKSNHIDLIIPCNEVSLFSGISDKAIAESIGCFGHNAYTAKTLEIQRDLVISTLRPCLPAIPPSGAVVSTQDEAKSFLFKNGKIAVKALGGGKIIFADKDEQLENCSFPAWVEPFLAGTEFSLHYLFLDGCKKFIGVTIDYPLLGLDNETLTGGMGSVVLPVNNEIIKRSLLNKCIKMIDAGLLVLKSETTISLNGFVSAQFRITPRGVIFTEFDSKPGDPEWIAILSVLNGNFLNLITDIKCEIQPIEQFGVSISLVQQFYPSKIENLSPIVVNFNLKAENLCFGESKLTSEFLYSGSSRTLCATETGQSLEIARSKALRLANAISKSTGLIFRTDIGLITQNKASLRVKKSLDDLFLRGGKRLMLRLSPEAYNAVKIFMKENGVKQETEAINKMLVGNIQ